jgi:hypothetical protein
LLASYFEEEELLRTLDEVHAHIQETQDCISDLQKKYCTGITPSDFSSDSEENFIPHDDDTAAGMQITPPHHLRRV